MFLLINLYIADLYKDQVLKNLFNFLLMNDNLIVHIEFESLQNQQFLSVSCPK